MRATAPVIDTSDPPFLPPADVVLELPAPLSVNRTRRIDWKSMAKADAWTRAADRLVYAAKRGRLKGISGPFEAIVTLSEQHTGIDLDNGIKAIIDYARRLELIVDDGPKYLRRLVVEWGHTPHGCRLTLRPYLLPEAPA